MQTIQTIAERHSGARITGWKMAAQGRWEEALAISVQPDENILQEIKDWIEQQPQDIALEAFFETGTGEKIFTGMRLESLSKEMQKNAVSQILAHVKGQETISNVIAAIHNVLDERLFSGNPDFLEVGVEGQWKSVGSCVVCKSLVEEPPMPFGLLRDVAAQLFGVHKNPVAMELGWKAPLPHWMGVPVCEKTDSGYQLQQEKYDTLISVLSGQSVAMSLSGVK